MSLPVPSRFPPGTCEFPYSIKVEFTNPAIDGYRGTVQRRQEGTLWLAPGYDPDGVRDHVAATVQPPDGFPGPGIVKDFTLGPPS